MRSFATRSLFGRSSIAPRLPASERTAARGRSRRAALPGSIALVLLGTMLAAGSALAQDAPPPQASLFFDERFASGVSDVAGMSIGGFGAGARLRVAPTLDLSAMGLVLRTAGTAEVRGEPAPGGAGGELGLRLTPWYSLPVRPYAFTSLGVLLFLKEPFLPGGDIYEGIITFGVGAEVPLDERWAVSARGFAVHLSNGQGLGPHNPAYDGYGGGLGLSWSFAPRSDMPSPWAGEPARPLDTAGRATWAPGAVVEGVYGRASETALTTGRVRITERLWSDGLALVDMEGGRLAGVGLGEIGVALVAHSDLASGAVHAGYRGYAGLAISVLTAQIEAHLSPEVDLVAMGHREQAKDGDPLWRSAVEGRVFPFPDLAIDIGVGFDRIGDDSVFGGDTSDPFFGVEWSLPLHLQDMWLSLFLERQVSTVDEVGVRFGYGAGTNLRDFARHDGFRRVR